jgi:drug/metabolite transporter (DMT)-like permease
MAILPSIVRGPLFMIASTGSYAVNDTLMKLATTGLPPYEVLMLRGIGATLWGIPLLLLLGYRRKMGLMFDKWVLARNLLETGAILAYVVALANMQIADSTALTQITPLLVLMGAALLLREPLGSRRVMLVLIGFAGALMIAQPNLQGISIYALLALLNAALGAARDLTGTRVHADVPSMIVGISAVLVVLVGATGAHFACEAWVAPKGFELTLLMGAGLFLIFGHFFLFLAYRVGPTRVTAPFYYSFTVWAVISGIVVFGQLPNPLALGGIVLVMASGVAIVLLDWRRRGAPPPASPAGAPELAVPGTGELRQG